MGLIPEEKIREIRERSDIVSLIGQFVSLRRAGTSFTGLCPFHSEKTPSFHVNPVKQFFYCFGCQKSGDIFKFLTEYQSRSFKEVAEELARRAGVLLELEIPHGRAAAVDVKKERSERELLLRVHEMACTFFQRQLQSSPQALAYLKQRGISEQMVSQFRMGYSSNSWSAFLEFSKKKGVPLPLLEKAGLIVKGEQDHFYDRFRDRLMFPLMNISCEILGFGGRSLPSDTEGDPKPSAKYINSPESILYKKGENLYGLFAAKEAIQKQKQVVLVEGNFDVLSLHQHGIKNVVAPMGTALTQAQICLLQRVLGQDGVLVLMLDGDRAGRQATLKDIFLLAEQQLESTSYVSEHPAEIRVAVLPDGEDPDTYVQRNREDFLSRLTYAAPAIDYVLERMLSQSVTLGIENKTKILSKVLPLLGILKNQAVLQMAVSTVAGRLAIDSQVIFNQLKTFSRNKSIQMNEKTHKKININLYTLSFTIRNLLSLCADHPYIIPKLKEDFINRLDIPEISDIFREVQHKIKQGFEITAADFIEFAPLQFKNAVASAVLSGIFIKTKGQNERNANIILSSIEQTVAIDQIQNEIKELKASLILATKENNHARINELSLRIAEIINYRQKIKGTPND